MLLCLGCADGNVISCPAGDGSARGNAAPTQLNKVENVKVLSFEKWSEQREAMGVDESTYGAMAAFAAKSAGKVLNGTDKNANYSPFSLYYALAMAAQGANGKTAEEMLKCLLECSDRKDAHVNFSDVIFPSYVQMSIGVELEKLIQYGMIGGLLSFGNGGMLDLLPPAFSYFEDKQTALDRKDKHEKERQQSIINYGNLVFGNVSGSTLTVDNSIHQIEQAIDEKGGEDKQELHELLDEVKELIENIQSSRAIPKQKKLFEKISNHMEKHGWFYGAVVQLLGTAALGLIGG